MDEYERKYTVVEKLHNGKYGSTSRVVLRDGSSTKTFVAKTAFAENVNGVELEVLPKMNHPNIVVTEDVFRDATGSVVVMEDLTGGDLFSYVEAAKGTLAEEKVCCIVRQVLKSVAYLHQHGIIHRDIKLENICRRGAHGEWCLVDFGFCARIDAAEQLNSCCGSPNYMAPEMLRASRSQAAVLPSSCTAYSSGVDVWAVGVTLYVLMCGKYPFYREKKAQWHKSILLGQFTAPPSTSTFTAESLSLLHGLLEVDPAQRLTAGEAHRHAFFASYNTPAASPMPVTPEKLMPSCAAEQLF